MAQSFYTEKKRRSLTLEVQHIVVALILVTAFFTIFQFKIVPWGVSQFVISLFQPTGEQLEKIGFVKFDGLVYASTVKDKEALYKGREVEIKKDYINRDFIFDFTYKTRTMDENGYAKGSGQFYAKSEKLGEDPIILEPWVGFWILSLVFSIVLTIFVTILLPTSVGFMSVLIDRQIDNNKAKIRLQSGFTDEIVELLTLPDDKLRDKDPNEVEKDFRTIWERTVSEESASSKSALTFEDLYDENVDLVAFRSQALYGRIKEFFSDFVLKEIEDTRDGLIWRRNHIQFMKGIRLYMSHHFTEKYSNNVQGMAYGGAALLIVGVGIRGLKFIPASKPSIILLTIFIEFSMLSLLAVTLIYTEEEERMDKLLKKMEDANRSQLETLRGQQHDIRLLANALVGQTSEIVKKRVEEALAGYLTSNNNIESAIAKEISEKILFGLRESYHDTKHQR